MPPIADTTIATAADAAKALLDEQTRAHDATVAKLLDALEGALQERQQLHDAVARLDAEAKHARRAQTAAASERDVVRAERDALSSEAARLRGAVTSLEEERDRLQRRLRDAQLTRTTDGAPTQPPVSNARRPSLVPAELAASSAGTPRHLAAPGSMGRTTDGQRTPRRASAASRGVAPAMAEYRAPFTDDAAPEADDGSSELLEATRELQRVLAGERPAARVPRSGPSSRQVSPHRTTGPATPAQDHHEQWNGHRSISQQAVTPRAGDLSASQAQAALLSPHPTQRPRRISGVGYSSPVRMRRFPRDPDAALADRDTAPDAQPFLEVTLPGETGAATRFGRSSNRASPAPRPRSVPRARNAVGNGVGTAAGAPYTPAPHGAQISSSTQLPQRPTTGPAVRWRPCRCDPTASIFTAVSPQGHVAVSRAPGQRYAWCVYPDELGLGEYHLEARIHSSAHLKVVVGLTALDPSTNSITLARSADGATNGAPHTAESLLSALAAGADSIDEVRGQLDVASDGAMRVCLRGDGTVLVAAHGSSVETKVDTAVSLAPMRSVAIRYNSATRRVAFTVNDVAHGTPLLLPPSFGDAAMCPFVVLPTAGDEAVMRIAEDPATNNGSLDASDAPELQ